MSLLKNPFGLRNDSIIMIEDLAESERGIQCNCVCPSCKTPFEARLGNVRVHHFAHSGAGCNDEIAFLTGLYLLVQEYLQKNVATLPQLTVYWPYRDTRFTEQNFFERIRFFNPNGKFNSTVAMTSKSVKFQDAEIVYKGKRPMAILLSYQSRQMALCIKPPSTVCKVYSTKPYENCATIQLDASRLLFGEMKKEQILEALGQKLHTWEWVYSPKAILALDSINELNDTWIEEVRQQREENQRKEQMRQEELVRRVLERQKRLEQETLVVNARIEEEAVKRKLDREQKLKAGYQEIVDRFIQQEEQIIDSYGQRWVRCENCEKIKPTYEFASYGGRNRVNLGVCQECSRSEK